MSYQQVEAAAAACHLDICGGLHPEEGGTVLLLGGLVTGSAQASAPGMSQIHLGGRPYASAVKRPSPSMATNDQPFRAVSGSGPSNLEPSV